LSDRPRKNTEQDLIDNSKATQVRLVATSLLTPGECWPIYNDRRIEFHLTDKDKKAQLSLTNPRDACEMFARFT